VRYRSRLLHGGQRGSRAICLWSRQIFPSGGDTTRFRGLYPLNLMLALCDQVILPVRGHLATMSVPRPYEQHICELTAETFMNFEKDSETCCVTRDGNLKVLRIRRCGDATGAIQSRIFVRTVSAGHASCLGKSWLQCGHCDSEEKRIRPLLKRLCHLIMPQALLRLPRLPLDCDIYLTKLLHCSAKGCQQCREEPLTDLIDVRKERLAFFTWDAT